MSPLKILLLSFFVGCVLCQLSVNKGPGETYNVDEKLPIVGNDQNSLSAVGSLSSLENGGSYGAIGGGLVLENANGHDLDLTASHISNFGDQLSASGRLNLLKTPDHNLNVNAFISRTMPNDPQVPSYNTHGGSVDYTFKNKLGASISASHTPVFQKTDYSAMGSLNLFRDHTSSLDLNAGASRSFSPYIPKSSWEPSFSFSYNKRF